MAAISLNTNLASLGAQRRLGESGARLGRAFERLSSGLRLNRARDDAAGLSVAAGLDVDARVFLQGVRNVNDGLGYLNVAGAAAGELGEILLRLRELSTQSSNGIYSDAQRQPLDRETQALVEEFNRLVQTTSFNGRAIFAPQNAELVLQAGYSAGGMLRTLLATSTTHVSIDGTFQPAQAFATGTNPSSVVTADFNGDGKVDLASADQGANTVSVLLGNGNGTFQPRTAYATGGSPCDVAVADFNGDGMVDLVSAKLNSGNAGVRLGNGDGTFQGQQVFTVGLGPRAVATADFNGDSKVDVVSADQGTATVSVLLGNGDGTFQPRQAFATGFLPQAVASADLNGDGKSLFQKAVQL